MQSEIRRTTLQLKVAVQNNVTAEFYHLKMENPIFRVSFMYSTQTREKGGVGGKILLLLESPYMISYYFWSSFLTNQLNIAYKLGE